MVELKKVNLGDIITFKNGKKKPAEEGTIPIYGGNGILGYTDRSNYKNCIAVGRVGAYCGSVYYEPGECWISDNAIAATPKADVDIYFAFYLLKSLNLNQRHIGTSQPLLTQEILNKIECQIPDLDIQKKISNILRTMDGKVECNTAINRNLQEQVQALFSSLYLESTKQDNFKSLIKILGGGTPKTGVESFWNGEIPFFTPKDVGDPYTFETEKTITDDGLAHCNSKLYPVNTTFVTARGTVGKVALAGVPMAMNQSCYALASDTLPELMVYFYSLEVVKSLKHKASGAVFDAIVTRDFDTEIINVLDHDKQVAFMDIAVPTFEQIHKNTIENQRLQALRDSLLPRLMSGELDVSDIEI